MGKWFHDIFYKTIKNSIFFRCSLCCIRIFRCHYLCCQKDSFCDRNTRLDIIDIVNFIVFWDYNVAVRDNRRIPRKNIATEVKRPVLGKIEDRMKEVEDTTNGKICPARVVK